MNQYPHDHPLWADINFTPEWLYQSVQQEAAESARARSTGAHLHHSFAVHTKQSLLLTRCATVAARTPLAGTRGLRSALTWSAVEDEMVHYCFSPIAPAEGMSADKMDKLLLRCAPPNAVAQASGVA